MPKPDQIQVSKFLSLVLRHQPELIGIKLDEAGWAEVDALLTAMAAHQRAISRNQLQQIVAESDKQRFAFSDDGQKIRASQGHSVEVELGYAAAKPPERLYHGTVEKFLASIRQAGLIKGSRHHVHLSSDWATAMQVGARRGKPVVLVVRCQEMHAAGISFFISANGVWLTDHVPPEHIDFPLAPLSSPSL
jgi:putative RNA 2'-phosphotransferase